MNPETTQAPSEQAVASDDLVAAIQRVLRESDEPLTLPKIKAHLPAALRQQNVEEVLRRQVAANVVQQYPRYRSQQDRFWDRPMEVHIATLIRQALAEEPLSWSDLRRKLPAYAQGQAEPILQDLLARREVHTYPKSGRSGERFGVKPPDPKDYLRSELDSVFLRLEPLGFSLSQLRAAALELLHDEEWKPTPPPPRTPRTVTVNEDATPRTSEPTQPRETAAATSE